ncbi:helix-turn-helix domain-containing protein [Falsiroseomonas tokyonensis]|uniref:Helix-turn-helix domain-containing protein n=1 Tax=Falsiroseomonas tokyonensis TaxID=430521 RepID=A0ABV7C2G4_9PROT|nr:helix-turn-helix domain-containing protein [Falsiroseomonas tokyonensis]MBU8541440.1 helix-turn-helix domain-containing protein [Falsiroseomonas tokyonensis]
MQTVSLARSPAIGFPFPVASRSGHTTSPAQLSGRPMRCARGTLIYAEGDSVQDLYKVVSGSIRTYRTLSDGRRLIASFALPGELFGLDGIGTHRCAAEAVTDAVMIAFARKEIEACVERDPLAAKCFQMFALEKLISEQDRCVLLGRKTASERVACFLLDLADRSEGHPHLIDLPMSRYDIGDYLGLSTETVSRSLTCFRKRGILADRGPHRVEVLDRDALEDAASGIETPATDCACLRPV